MSLPSLRQVLTGLVNDVQPVRQDGHGDGTSSISVTIESLPQSTHTALLALHQIYPQLLLTSLDLLDTSLVTRYVVSAEGSHVARSIYYVRSSQTRSSRYGGQITRTVYEVRPTAWHCTCPSFAFSAFSVRNVFDPFECGTEDFIGFDGWGGEMRGGQLAICKHLLAVVIGSKLNLIPEKTVDMDTLANYAFGAA